MLRQNLFRAEPSTDTYWLMAALTHLDHLVVAKMYRFHLRLYRGRLHANCKINVLTILAWS